MPKQRILLLLVFVIIFGVADAQIEQILFVQSFGAIIDSGSNDIQHSLVVGEMASSYPSTIYPYDGSNIGFLTSDLVVNSKPVANAGLDQSALEGTPLTLDGSGSFDIDGDSLLYTWTSLDGLLLDDSTLIQPGFIAPDVKAIHYIRFVLLVFDGQLWSDPDTVEIKVTDPEWVPIIYPGNTTFIGKVFLNFSAAVPGEDIVGAFVDNECRGIGVVFEYQNVMYTTFNIQTDIPDTVSFIVYDYSRDALCEATKTLFVVPNVPIGSPVDPHLVHGICCEPQLVLKENLGPLDGIYSAAEVISVFPDDQISISLMNSTTLDAPLVLINDLLENFGVITIQGDGCQE